MLILGKIRGSNVAGSKVFVDRDDAGAGWTLRIFCRRGRVVGLWKFLENEHFINADTSMLTETKTIHIQ